jgi:hypothetical protein
MGHLKGYFEGVKTFSGSKKVKAFSKYPEKFPIMYFAQNKKKIFYSSMPVAKFLVPDWGI